MKKVLLTGADGLLGSNLVRELLSRKYSVRVFIEKGRTTGTLDGLDIERFTGDIMSLSDLKDAAGGCTCIVHAAAVTSLWPSRCETIRQINITGTRNVIAAALDCHIERMIHIGTANSFGAGSKNDPGDENRPFNAGKYRLDYIDSKYQAQLEVLEAVRLKGLPALIVNPTFMIGSYDSKPSSGAMVMSVAASKIPGYTRGGKNYIYVKDAVAGIVNALEIGEIGECYILGNVNMSFNEAFTMMADVLHAKRPRLYLPPQVAIFYALFSEILSKVTGKPPKVNLPMAKLANDDCYYSAGKARKYLNLPQTDISNAILECHNWLQTNGYYNK